MTLTSADATRIAAEMVMNSNALVGTPAQTELLQVAAGFAIAAAIFDLAAAVRGKEPSA